MKSIILQTLSGFHMKKTKQKYNTVTQILWIVFEAASPKKKVNFNWNNKKTEDENKVVDL